MATVRVVVENGASARWAESDGAFDVTAPEAFLGELQVHGLGCTSIDSLKRSLKAYGFRYRVFAEDRGR